MNFMCGDFKGINAKCRHVNIKDKQMIEEEEILTQKWMRSRMLILKKSDRLNPNLIFVYDVLPLHIQDEKIYFSWGENVPNKTLIKYVSDLKSLYKSLMFEELPDRGIYAKG